MTASPFDSPVWRAVLFDADLSPLFTDTAVLRAELLVLGALALTQAKAGEVPDVSAQAIQRAALEVQIDPAAMAARTAQTGDPTEALIAQFRAEMQAPEHAKWVHHASDTRLTAATGQSLRLRQCCRILAARAGLDSPPVAVAFHADAGTRAGLAAGLGLVDGGPEDPVAHARSVGRWLADQAHDRSAGNPISAALVHQIGHLDAALQSAPEACADLTILMTLPQMVLGLGGLLNRSV